MIKSLALNRDITPQGCKIYTLRFILKRPLIDSQLLEFLRNFGATQTLNGKIVQLLALIHKQKATLKKKKKKDRTKETTITEEINNAFDWRSRPKKREEEKKKV